MTTTSWRGVPKSGCATAKTPLIIKQTTTKCCSAGFRSSVGPLWVIRVSSDRRQSWPYVRCTSKSGLNSACSDERRLIVIAHR